MQGQSLEELHGSVVVLEAQSRAEGARVERPLEELASDLKASIATEVRKGITGAALGNAARAAASEGARKTADELGVSAQALDMNLLDLIQSLLAEVVESEGEATRAAVASSQADMEVAIERGRTDVQSQLDDTKREAEIDIEEVSEEVTKRRMKKSAVSLTFK